MRYLPYLPQYYSNQPAVLDSDIFTQYQLTSILRNSLLNDAKAYNKHHTFVQKNIIQSPSSKITEHFPQSFARSSLSPKSKLQKPTIDYYCAEHHMISVKIC